MRQSGNIDSGAGTVIGKTAINFSHLWAIRFIRQLGYIDDYDTNDINRLVFTDQNGVQRTEPYTAAGTSTSTHSLPLRDWLLPHTSLTLRRLCLWKADAITVEDANGDPIAGIISGAAISFSFAYDANTQGGRTAGTDAAVTVVAGNAGSAKPVVATYTITRAVGQNITLTAEQDRAYVNPA